MGQAQFAQLLQPVLQDLADSLAKTPVVIVQPIKVVNGYKLKKVDYLSRLISVEGYEISNAQPSGKLPSRTRFSKVHPSSFWIHVLV